MVDKKTYVVEYDLRKKGDGATKGAKETEKLRKETDKLSLSFKDAEGNARDLDDILQGLYQDRAAAIQRYMETGDDADRKQRNQLSGWIRQVKAFKNELADATKTAASVGEVFGSSFKGVGMPAALGAGGAVIAGALPPLGAMIGGAFSGTVVGAAMAGGILAAIKDPAVRSAASNFGDAISAEFFGSGDAFVFPIRRSLMILREAVQDMNLEETFAKVAPQVDDVADGLGRMGKNLIAGLNPTLDRSAAFTKEFADGMADLGWALGTMIDRMSASEGSVEGLNVLFKLVNGTLVVLGNTVNGLADIFDTFTDVGARVTGALEDIPEPLQMMLFGHAGFSAANDVFEDLNASTFDVANGMNVLGGSMRDAASAAQEQVQELQALERALAGMLELEFGLEEAQDKVAESTQRLKDQLKEQREEGVKGAGQLTGNTQAARDNREMVRGLAKDYGDLMIEQQEAGLSTDKTRQQFEDLLVSMGFSRTEAKKYADSLLDVKSALDAIESKTVTLTVRTQTELTYARSGAGGRNVIDGMGVRGFASGGTTPAFQPFYTHPGETMWSDKQHYVATKQQTADLARMGAGSGNITMTVMPGGSDPFVQALVELISRYVRITGGSGAALGITR